MTIPSVTFFGLAGANGQFQSRRVEILPRKISTPAREVAREILRYFLRNPQAADNLEGITRWRLLEERVHRQLRETDKALRLLVREGLLDKTSADWIDAIYRLNPSNRAAAEHFVGQTDPKINRGSRNK